MMPSLIEMEARDLHGCGGLRWGGIVGGPDGEVEDSNCINFGYGRCKDP